MKSTSNLPVRLTLAMVGTVLIGTALIAQTPNRCPTPLSPTHQGWALGSTVYFDDSPMPPSVRTQLRLRYRGGLRQMLTIAQVSGSSRLTQITLPR